MIRWSFTKVTVERERTSFPRLYGMICKPSPTNGLICVKTQRVSRSSNLLRNLLRVLVVSEGTVVGALMTSRSTTAAPAMDENGMFIWH